MMEDHEFLMGDFLLKNVCNWKESGWTTYFFQGDCWDSEAAEVILY